VAPAQGQFNTEKSFCTISDNETSQATQRSLVDNAETPTLDFCTFCPISTPFNQAGHAACIHHGYLQKTTLPYEANYLDLDPVIKERLGNPVINMD
jgi:hypothetical protein